MFKYMISLVALCVFGGFGVASAGDGYARSSLRVVSAQPVQYVQAPLVQRVEIAGDAGAGAYCPPQGCPSQVVEQVQVQHYVQPQAVQKIVVAQQVQQQYVQKVVAQPVVEKVVVQQYAAPVVQKQVVERVVVKEQVVQKNRRQGLVGRVLGRGW